MIFTRKSGKGGAKNGDRKGDACKHFRRGGGRGSEGTKGEKGRKKGGEANTAVEKCPEQKLKSKQNGRRTRKGSKKVEKTVGKKERTKKC